MRDVLLVAFMAVALPLMMWRPAWGALGWVWWGIMNPHRFAWGFATTIPFAWAIGIVTVIGALFSKEPKRLKGGLATGILLVFVAYMVFTTFFALAPLKAWPMLERTVKIQVGTLLALTLLYRKEHAIALMWVVAGSIGFYAIKGGLFTIATLGQFRVWGPEDSFIYDNNAFALATVMSIPLWAFLLGVSFYALQGTAVAAAVHSWSDSTLGGLRHRQPFARRRGCDRCDGRIPVA